MFVMMIMLEIKLTLKHYCDIVTLTGVMNINCDLYVVPEMMFFVE